MLTVLQLLIVIIALLVESIRRHRFIKKQSKAVVAYRALANDRSATVSKAVDMLRHMREEILENIGNKQLARKSIHYLMEEQGVPRLSTEKGEVFNHLKILFNDGGPWRRIHTLCISDPNSALLFSFVNSIEEFRKYIDPGSLVKLVCVIMMTSSCCRWVL